MDNILDIKNFLEIRERLKKENKTLVFTNGCFDVLHAGHVDYLKKARELGDALILGLNSDASIKNIKGPNRPIVPQNERAFVLANLKPVDYVIYFDEDTPEKLIHKIIPDVLVKGADWAIENVVGKNIVEKHGGCVKTIKFVHKQSTTNIIDTILEKYK